MARELKAVIMLFITSIIWGMGFVAQALGGEIVGPFTFNFGRSIVASVFLLLTYLFFINRVPGYKNEKFSHKKTLKGGIFCGILLFISLALQQIGIMHTTTAKAGFLTGLYIVIIPVVGIFFRHFPTKKIIFCVIFALVGTYFLSMNGSFKMNYGDIIVIISAITFSFHVICMSHFASDVQGVLLSLIQFFITAVLSLVVAIIFEKIDINDLRESIFAILYSGILSSGVGFTAQLLALKDLDPTVASLITSLESVFSAIFGWIILNQNMSKREIFGALIIFIATIIAQIPDKREVI